MILRAICPVRKPLILRMSLQDVEALGYAVITNRRRCAGDKAIRVSGVPAAERVAQRRAEQETDPRQGRAGRKSIMSGPLIHDSSDQSIMAAPHAPEVPIHP
jgi:hypothetical protein